MAFWWADFPFFHCYHSGNDGFFYYERKGWSYWYEQWRKLKIKFNNFHEINASYGINAWKRFIYNLLGCWFESLIYIMPTLNFYHLFTVVYFFVPCHGLDPCASRKWANKIWTLSRGWTSTLRINRRTRLLAVFYLIKKIDVNSIYKVIDVYVYLELELLHYV